MSLDILNLCVGIIFSFIDIYLMKCYIPHSINTNIKMCIRDRSSLYQFFQINYIIEKIEKQFNQYTNNKLMNSSFHSLA